MISPGARRIIKQVIPGRLLGMATGLFYGWSGNYRSWKAAESRSTGYDTEEIRSKVRSATSRVRDNREIYERDTVLCNESQYSFPLLSGLMWIAAINKASLNVLDFGGSLGSSYYQNRKFLDSLESVNWCVVEQPGLADIGKKEFATDRLRFFSSIDDCLKFITPDLVLLSGVIQYIEDPYKLLDSIIEKNPGFIIIDRTPFVRGKDRITIQKVHPAIYKASYPCWFFNKSRFLDFMTKSYELVAEFDALDKANFPSEFKGFIFRKR